MSIWVTPHTIAELTAASRNTASAALGIQFTAIGDDWIEAMLPLEERTECDAGVLDPGALAILAETLGSVGATMCIDTTRQMCLGQIFHVQHPRTATCGPLRARAAPLDVGERAQLWDIQVRDGTGERVCIAHLTVAVLDRPRPESA